MSRLRKSALFVLLGAGVFQLARLGLLLRYREAFAELSAGRVAAAWLSGLRFDLSILLAALALPLVALNLPVRVALAPRWQRAWGWLAFALVVILALVLGGDVAYFEHVQRHMAAELLTMESDWGFLVRMAFGPALPLLVGVAALLAALGALWRRILAAPVEARLHPARFALVAALLFVGIRGSVGHKPLNAIDAFATGDAAEAQLALNGAFTGARAMLRSGHARTVRFYPDAEVRRLAGVADVRYPVERTVPPRPPRHNVVFVLLESWSAHYVDAFAHRGLGATPRFDRLAAEGAKFTRFYAAGQRSYEGLQATLTGLPSLPGMPTLTSGLMTRVSRLGAMAHEAGYRTLFLQSSKRRSLRIDAIAAATGFAEYYGMEDMPTRLDYPDAGGAAFGWDYEMLQTLLGKLHGETRPFLAYAFTGTTHTPYPRVPARFETRPHDNGENGFLNALSYADWSLGEFLDAARREPWFGNTIFVFAADHTRGGMEVRSFDEGFHVPLVVWAPGLVAPRELDVVGSHLDVLPTLVELMGIGGTYSAIGTPLFEKDPATATAMVTGGELVGEIGARGFVSHTLARRVDARAEPGAPPGLVDDLERHLLATCQLVYTLHETNCWAAPEPRGAPRPPPPGGAAPQAGGAGPGRPPG